MTKRKQVVCRAFLVHTRVTKVRHQGVKAARRTSTVVLIWKQQHVKNVHWVGYLLSEVLNVCNVQPATMVMYLVVVVKNVPLVHIDLPVIHRPHVSHVPKANIKV
tara:strand:- start:432 stop:746 length:315 start_codon:yes stop_codon:yes gene_type:complete